MFKKVLLSMVALLFVLKVGAQTTFKATNADGFEFGCTITNAALNEIKVSWDGKFPAGYALGKNINIPSTLTYNGQVYNVVEIGYFNYGRDVDDITIAEGIRKIGDHAFYEVVFTKVSIPSTISELGFYSFLMSGRYTGGKSLGVLDLSHTSISTYLIGSLAVMSRTDIDEFLYDKVILPATTSSVHLRFIRSYSLISTGRYLSPKTLQFTGEVPPTVTDVTLESSYSYPNPLPSTDSIFVPVDYTKAYEEAAVWSVYDGKYYEELTIGANGYTSYYLENENFLVPAGCTAYIVTDATAITGSYGNAVVKAFPAGSIIPKQTGFVLEGTPNARVVYQANVSGTEVDVTGNLLVGTAVEKEFSGGSYKYYIFGKGAQGQGFYYQGTRGGQSINVKAHRAGLRLPTSGFAPAKGFAIDFEAAKNNAVTGISSVNLENASDKGADVIYDLQGRRVYNASKGVFIVNGKKVVK